MSRADFTISCIDEHEPVDQADGIRMTAGIRVAHVDGDMLDRMRTVAVVEIVVQPRDADDYQRCRLRLYRAARDRLRELATQAQRDAD